MFVSHKALNIWNLMTAFCRQGAQKKRCCLAEEEARAGADTAITAFGIPLAPLAYINYLGRVLLGSDDDWPEVVRSLQKASQKWVWLTRVLSSEGVDNRNSVQIY